MSNLIYSINATLPIFLLIILGKVLKTTKIISDEFIVHVKEAVNENRISMSPASLMLYEKLISEFFPSLSQRISDLITSSEAQEAEYMSLDAHLDEADDKTLTLR